MIRSFDELDHISVPNCPDCLEPMEPAVGGWWCAACEVVVRPEQQD